MMNDDDAEQLLTDWAQWRLTSDSVEGFGDSSIVRFVEPVARRGFCSRPLWFKNNPALLVLLNGRLSDRFGKRIIIIMMIFGLTDRQLLFALQNLNYQRTQRTIRRIKNRALDIARRCLAEKAR